ncbi:MAG TPA: hypothetical protein VIF62_22085, partial [Labilithrix sp.]
DISDCFLKPQYGVVKQSDGSNLAVIVVKSWKVEPTVHVTLSSLSGNLPIAVVSLGDMTIMGSINGSAFGQHPEGGGYDNQVGESNGSGPGGGPKGTTTFGATGGSYCGLGGPGSATLNGGGTPSAPAGVTGVPELVPLRGGAAGGSGVSSLGGAGGAGLQLVASGAFSLAAGGSISVGGGGGSLGATAGGGGAGGSLLIEAQTISVAGTLAANGGGGGGAGVGSDDGKDGTPDSTGAAGSPGPAAGGVGSAGATIDGQAAPAPSAGNDIAGGGGGGAGRIRLNTKTGAADITSATISPLPTTACVSQGTIK